MKYIYYLILLTVIFGGCTKELPYPDLENEELLVLNGLISPGEIPAVHLSQSCHISDLSCEQKKVINAQVFLKDESGNVLAEMTHEADGIYTAKEFQIEHYKTYKIEASNAGLETISAKAKIPKSFNCTLIDFDEEVYLEHLSRTFQIEIEDNPDEENYYLIDGWVDILNGEHEEYEYEVNGYVYPHVGFLTNDVNAENMALTSTTDVVSHPLEFVFLPDKNFNGESYQLEFGLFEEDVSFDKYYELKAHISVKSVSKEVYDYYRSVSLRKLTVANFLSEPAQIFSNIEKGIGIFGGYTEQEFILDLPPTEFWIGEGFRIENRGCTAPCTVKFFSDMGKKVNFVWDFGDGTTSTERDPEHIYETAGIYTVSLQASIGDNHYLSSEDLEIK